MMINRDTQICCSFAVEAGNMGCIIHNAAFQIYSLNYIYKSFSISDIKEAVKSMRCLGFRGAAVTMPYKVDVVDLLDDLDSVSKELGVVNTIVNTNGVLVGYNTDFYSVSTYCKQFDINRQACILGKGGMAQSSYLALKEIGFSSIDFITRDVWSKISDLRECFVINCTPAEVKVHESNQFVDCSVETSSGRALGILQASKQFELYTNKTFPMEHIVKLIGLKDESVLQGHGV